MPNHGCLKIRPIIAPRSPPPTMPQAANAPESCVEVFLVLSFCFKEEDIESIWLFFGN